MDKLQRSIVRAFRAGLPVSEEPFRAIADEAGLSVDELLAQLEAWKTDGTIRRFGAILRHRQAGYSVNAMGAWNVPDDRAEEFGLVAAEMTSVSHCYQRPRFEGFPYNIYTMIHGRSRQECEAAAQEISRRTGIADYDLLYTTAEFKKSTPVYFGPSDCSDRSDMTDGGFRCSE
jgi:DNA-binding Lrp family transcriptional regulator